MTDCIKTVEGTIGYIDSGHGHTENLNEIELKNADGTYLSSKEASTKGGIAAAAGAVPERADMDFGTVNLLNRPGEFTWPIVAMTYVYARKDLSHIQDPQEQTLLKAFLTTLYDPNYIDACLEKFAFTAVPDNVRQLGLDGIDMIVASSNATDWIFENSTTPGEGQGNYIISDMRRSYGEYQRELFEGDTAHFQNEINSLREELSNERARIGKLTDELDNIKTQAGGSPIFSSSQYAEFTEDDAGQITAALAMSAVSIVLWVLAIGFVAFQKLHRPNKDVVSGEVVQDSQNGAINGGSGHAARTAAKHSAITQDSDMVA